MRISDVTRCRPDWRNRQLQVCRRASPNPPPWVRRVYRRHPARDSPNSPRRDWCTRHAANFVIGHRIGASHDEHDAEWRTPQRRAERRLTLGIGATVELSLELITTSTESRAREFEGEATHTDDRACVAVGELQEGHRPFHLHRSLPQSFSASRFTAGAAGFLSHSLFQRGLRRAGIRSADVEDCLRYTRCSPGMACRRRHSRRDPWEMLVRLTHPADIVAAGAFQLVTISAPTPSAAYADPR